MEVRLHRHRKAETDQNSDGETADLLSEVTSPLHFLFIGNMKAFSGQTAYESPAEDTSDKHAAEVTLSFVNSTVEFVLSRHFSVVPVSTAGSSLTFRLGSILMNRSFFNFRLNFFVVFSFLLLNGSLFGAPGLQVSAVSEAVSGVLVVSTETVSVAPFVQLDNGVDHTTNINWTAKHECSRDHAHDGHEHQALGEASESPSQLTNSLLSVIQLCLKLILFCNLSHLYLLFIKCL
jgi:hypothetical protein